MATLTPEIRLIRAYLRGGLGKVKATAMRTHITKRIAGVATSLLAGLLCAGSAQAALGDVRATFDARDPVGYPAGVFTFKRTGGTLDTFKGTLLDNSPTGQFIGICLELNEGIPAPPSGPFVWNVKTLDKAPVDARGILHLAGGMGATRAGQLAQLIGGAVGGYLPGAYSLSPVEQVALQMAVWEIVFETAGNLSVTGGNIGRGFSNLGNGTTGGYPSFIDAATTAAATTKANFWLGNLTNYTPARNLLAITWNDRQDFLVQAVPIPPAAWLLGSGLLGLFAVARRRKSPV